VVKNVLDFPAGYRAVIAYDPALEMFRGEFIDLNEAQTMPWTWKD
jgi:predicted HicB family RNase H-like nuclease